MPNATIEIPSRMSLEAIFKFAKELDYYSEHDRLIIDLPHGESFFSPFQMIFLSTKIKRFRDLNKNVVFIFNRWEQHSYLSHMGFFSMCGFNHGKQLGQAPGSDNYLPITELSRSAFYENDDDKYEELPDLIQRRVDRISEIISRDSSSHKVMFDVLSFSIREIFRNVFEHGETDKLYYCIQYWPRSNKVEFAVSDFGIGIRKSLGTNPNFRFNTDKEALEHSLLPSVSGKTHLPRMSSNWFNSGYGLYMTNRLARNGGNFAIASGVCAIHLSRMTKNNYITSFPGTALRLNLDVGQIGSVEARLSEFRKDGAEIAKRISGSGNRPPSAMSLLLRRDYQQ